MPNHWRAATGPHTINPYTICYPTASMFAHAAAPPPPGSWYWAADPYTGQQAQIQSPVASGPYGVPPSYGYGFPPPGYFPLPPPGSPEKKKDSSDSDSDSKKKKDKKKKEKKDDANITTMPPVATTLINLLLGPTAPWSLDCNPGEMKHRRFRADVDKTLQQLMDGFGIGAGEGWKMTECHELGDGEFEMGRTWKWEDAGKKSAKGVGWTGERGVGRPEVVVWCRKGD
ncbi:hypothetical protein K402DRAFT_394491 [Aulographum hederae CBS 113979]|uniref:Uncharacterized protein n=1 Tax=Aulographum hederae CBS 113979 TaxID=1176131 RepID=A0A6G1GYP4_9PEZI|nr:hypothetical protein K402DRAFT_394491 [Aulographum hederae CBS 113979]